MFLDIIFAYVVSCCRRAFMGNLLGFAWGLRRQLLMLVLSLVSIVVPYTCKRLFVKMLQSVVLPTIWSMCKLVYGYIVGTCTYWKHYFMFQYTLRARYMQLRVDSSKRTRKILDILDSSDIGEDELELLERGKYVRCAVLISRRARIGLKYPKYSKPNERVVADYILRTLPDSMTIGQKHRVLPLAIKMTFVKSHYEVRAEQHFSWMQELVDKC